MAWTESVPSNASKVGNAPIDFRSVWTAIKTGMEVEHFWTSASQASQGDLRPGGTRTYYINQASGATHSSQITARLAMTFSFVTVELNPVKDLQKLRVYESAGTYQVGTSWLAEMNEDAGTGYWLRQAGATPSIPASSSTTLVAFSQTFATAPTVHVTSSSVSWAFCVVSSSISNFVSAFSSYANAASTATLYWEALGTMASANY